ncbi:MAG: CAP domain-containing protein [Pseudomonadota bacterium]
MTTQNPLTRGILLLMTVALLAGCSPSLLNFGGPERQAPENPIDNTKVEFDVQDSFNRINSVRQKYFLSAFKPDPRLMEAAQRHANLMGRTGKFGHEFGPDTKFKRRIFAVGFENSAGENIGVGYRSIEAALEGWLNSPGHRKILLKRNYSLGGIAYAPNTSGKNGRLNHFWVLIVGSE